MALFQPTNITPSTFSGTGTIDVAYNLDVTWQVNGNSAMVAYRIIIMQNDTTSTVKFDSGKVSLQTPFYGVDRNGNPQYFTATITTIQMVSAGMTNGYANGYKLKIIQWWGSTDAESVTQTSPSYFITRSKPTVTMASIPATFSFPDYTFSATYAQTQGDALEWMRWQLEVDNGAYESLYDTGKVYGTGVLEAYYKGFMPGNAYRVKCTIQTENGVEADTGWVTFQSLCNEYDDEPDPYACPLCDHDAVKIGAPKNFYLKGSMVPPYAFYQISGTSRYSLSMPDGASGTWTGAQNEPLYIYPPYTIFISGEFVSLPQMWPLFTAECNGESIYVYARNNGLYIFKGERLIFKDERTLENNTYFNIILSDTDIYEGYKKSGVQVYSHHEVPRWQSEMIYEVVLRGSNRFHFVLINKGDVSENRGYSWAHYQPGEYPAAMDETEFILIPNNTLYTGEISQEINNVYFFRRWENEPNWRYIAEIPLGFTTILDYSARSQHGYEYTAITTVSDPYHDNIYTTGYTTDIKRPVWWNYTVLCCFRDSTGIYHVIDEYRFALDVASGSVGNNTNISLLKNFTKYPTRQAASANYRSGTLTAYIGRAQDYKYIDSLELMQELYGLSTSKLTKFLKTRKGDLIMIETGSPITQQIGDKFKEQPAKIGLPWVEVGDAEGLTIIGGGMVLDAPHFYVDLVTMTLVMVYYPQYVNSGAFTLNTMDLMMNDPGIYPAEDYSMSSNKCVMLKVSDD